ncbi:MAG: potassium transporter [Solirubrobacterales bacterium]|nr:potassium transporter [Solirubrobacterales bacterium]
MRLARGRVGPNLNWQLIVPIISGTLLAVGLGMLVCAAQALVGGDGATMAFAGPAAVVIPLAAVGVASARRLPSMPLRARDGFLAVTLAWLAAAVVGGVPFLLHGTFERPLDALFESMSGFTTTGATLIRVIEGEPDAILLWRSLSQWIGGVGIVVLVVAIAPATGLATQRVFYAETSGVTAERLTPRIAETAKIIWGLYLVVTTTAVLAFLLVGMGLFDAVNHGFTTVATGGFSTRTASLAAFNSIGVEIVALVFMVISGVNFAFYWRALRGNGIWPQAAEVRAYVLILLGGTAVVTASLVVSEEPGSFAQTLHDAGFTVTSIITSGGFITTDFDQWNDFARGFLLLLMFVGGCAGSTAGGLKVIRVLLLAKSAGQEVQRQLRPKAVQVLRTRGRIYTEELRRGVLGFFAIYMTVTAVGTMAMLATGLDMISAFSSVAATLNVVGLGLGEIGATDNFEAISGPGRAILTVTMLAGRLEVFTVLVLLTPAFWRPNVA